MLRKIIWGNVLLLSLLMLDCGQAENANSSNSGNTNTTTTNSGSRVSPIVSSNNAAPSPGASNTGVERPAQTPAQTPSKLPHPGELGNDARLANDNDRPASNTNANSNTPRKPRIEERKPPERERP